MMVKDLVKDLEKGDRTMEHLKTVTDRTEDNLMRMAQQLQNTQFQQANQFFASSYNSLAMQQSFMGAAANQQMLNRDPFGGIMGGSGGL